MSPAPPEEDSLLRARRTQHFTDESLTALIPVGEARELMPWEARDLWPDCPGWEDTTSELQP